MLKKASEMYILRVYVHITSMQILWQVRTSLSELNLDVTIYLIELNSGEVHPSLVPRRFTSIPARASRNQLAHQSARDEAGCILLLIVHSEMGM